MYPIPTPSQAASTGGYQPYFYQAGLHQLYGLPTAEVLRQRPDAPHSWYGSSPIESLFGRADHIQTVEQVIANGYFSIPRGDPVTAIISDKQQTSRLGLDDVISQVRSRYEIYEQNLHQIELGKCAAMNALYASEAYQGPADSKEFYSRHKRLQELYEQQRDERTSLWKDVSRLRLALPESAQNYLAAHRKMAALTDISGDAP